MKRRPKAVHITLNPEQLAELKVRLSDWEGVSSRWVSEKYGMPMRQIVGFLTSLGANCSNCKWRMPDHQRAAAQMGRMCEKKRA